MVLIQLILFIQIMWSNIGDLNPLIHSSISKSSVIGCKTNYKKLWYIGLAMVRYCYEIF